MWEKEESKIKEVQELQNNGIKRKELSISKNILKVRQIKMPSLAPDFNFCDEVSLFSG